MPARRRRGGAGLGRLRAGRSSSRIRPTAPPPHPPLPTSLALGRQPRPPAGGWTANFHRFPVGNGPGASHRFAAASHVSWRADAGWTDSAQDDAYHAGRLHIQQKSHHRTFSTLKIRPNLRFSKTRISPTISAASFAFGAYSNLRIANYHYAGEGVGASLTYELIPASSSTPHNRDKVR